MTAVETAQLLLQSSSYTMNIAYQGNNIFSFQSVAGELDVSGYLVDHGDLLNYSFYIGPIDPANYAGELYLGYTYNAYTTPAGVTNLYTNDVVVTVNPDGSETYVVTNGQAQLLPPGQPLPQDVIPCFAAGTRILTDRGEVAVESLRPGDLVATLSGAAARRAADGPLLPGGEPDFRSVCWVGSRTLRFGTHPAPLAQMPVRIEAGALGDGLPHRALVLSPEHCLLLDGHLVPAKLLVNGHSIRRDAAARSVTYLHVALDGHDVLLAEGAAAESWLDTGNRAFFAEAEAISLHPAAPLEPEAAWNALACAPHLLDGPVLDALHARLDALAGPAPEAAALAA